MTKGKRVNLNKYDLEQFKLIKEKLGAETDIDTLRKLMHFFLTSEWITKLFEQFEKHLIMTLHQSLLFQNQDTAQ